MRIRRRLLVTMGMAACGLFARHVEWVTIQGPITPVTARYLISTIDRAEKEDAECVVIALDTPGGLMQATLDIDKRLLSARVPVVVYVSPSGGRAASAGVFITYAAHVAAMAPSTNIGSAHPVSMMGKDTSKVMTEKVVNDAVAHLKGLADRRGRNAAWAEEAIRASQNITEKEALKIGVIDLIAKDRADLMEKLEGRLVRLDEHRTVTLRTREAEIREREMDWRHQILDKIADPNIAYFLLLIAALGIYFELSNPGLILPGVIGVICGVLFLFASQILSINAAGVVLIVLAIVFFILEIYTPTFGVLTAGGILAFITGSLMLFRTPEARLSLSVLVPAIGVFLAFVLIGLFLAIRTRLTRPKTGKQGLIGEKGVALGRLDPTGQVLIHGEVWKAEGVEPIKKGDPVEVVRVEGLTLIVRKDQSKQGRKR